VVDRRRQRPTNAGRLCCVKYGVTRDYVLALQVVTGTGELVRLGRWTAKSVVGYDLVGLMVGSEGTLGVVTEVSVHLHAAKPAEQTVAGYFSSVVTRAEPSPRSRGRTDAVRARARQPALPGGRRPMEAHGAVARRRRRAPRPRGRPRCPGRCGGRRGARLLHRCRGHVGGAVHRPGRGGGVVRGPTPRLPGPGSGWGRRSPRTCASRGPPCPRCCPASTRRPAATTS
jgi:FAD/FMN-containing dehydrogenase